jgi:PAS domain S-box-containing protein
VADWQHPKPASQVVSKKQHTMNSKIHSQLFLNAPIGFALLQSTVDLENNSSAYRFTEANGAFGKITNLKPEEVTGKTLAEILAQNPHAVFEQQKALNEVEKSGNHVATEQFCKHTQRWYQINVFSPSAKMFAILINDITELKQKPTEEITPERSTNSDYAGQFKTLIHALPDMIFIMHRDGTILDIFGADPEKLIAPADELTGTNIRDCFDEQEYARHIEMYERCLATHETGFIEFELNINNQKKHFESRIKSLDSETLLTVVSETTHQKVSHQQHLEELSFRKFLFDNERLGLVILDGEHKVVDANPQFCNMTGYSFDELLLMHTWDFDTRMSKAEVEKNFDVTVNINRTFSSTHRRKDGSFYEVEVSAIDFTWKGQRLIYCACQDISERIAASQKLADSESKYRHLVENISDVLFTLDENGTIKYMSPAVKRLSGFDATEYIGVHFAEFIHPDHLAQIQSDFAEIKSSNYFPSEYRIRTKTGEDVWVRSLTQVRFNHENKPEYHGLAQDITASRRADEELKDSRMKLEFALEIAKMGYWKYELATNKVEWSDGHQKLFGIPLEAFKGNLDAVQECVHPDDRAHGEANLLKAIQEQQPFVNYYRVIHPDGAVKWLYSYGELIRNEHEELTHIFGITQDITERRIADESLRESEELNRRLLKAIPDRVIRTDIEGNITYANDPILHHFPFISTEKLVGRNMLSFIHEKDLERAMENTRLMFEKPLGAKEYTLRFDDEHCLDFEVNGDVMRDAQNNPTGMVYVIRDLTQRKQADLALRESEARLKTLSNNLPDGLVYQLNSGEDGSIRKFTFMSGGVERIHGITVEQALHDAGSFYSQIIEEDRELVAEKEAASIATMSVFRAEFRIKKPSGEIRWLLAASSPRRLDNNEVLWDGIEMDITERKRSEVALQESETRFRKIYEDGANGMILAGRDFKFQIANQTFCEMTGYTEDELKHLTFAQITHHDDREKDISNVKKLLTGEIDVYRIEKKYIKKNGQVFWGQVTVSPIFDSNKQFLYFVGIIADISVRKTAEEKLILSERTYREIFDSITDALFIHDIETGDILDVNDTMLSQFGYKRDELPDLTVERLSALTEPYTNKRAVALIKQAAGGETVVFEWLNRKKNGELFYSENILKFVVIAGKERILAIVRDITERRQAKEALEKRLVALTQPLDSPEGITINDLFSLTDIQLLQDEFAQAVGVASIITYPDGKPITEPSNFCRLCSDIIRKTEIGCANCFKSDAILGRPNNERAYHTTLPERRTLGCWRRHYSWWPAHCQLVDRTSARQRTNRGKYARVCPNNWRRRRRCG